MDNERLIKLLVVEFDLDWAENATINKSADFVVAIYEYKRVELPIRGVYFEHFSVEPVKSGSGAIFFVPAVAEVNHPAFSVLMVKFPILRVGKNCW